MPRGDRTGPEGRGSMTGRGLGDCARRPGTSYGTGYGLGNGYGIGRRGVPVNPPRRRSPR